MKTRVTQVENVTISVQGKFAYTSLDDGSDCGYVVDSYLRFWASAYEEEVGNEVWKWGIAGLERDVNQWKIPDVICLEYCRYNNVTLI